jgi:putative acetyltransferase
VTSLFALLLLAALALTAALAFAPERLRPRLRLSVILASALCWLLFAASLKQSVSRTLVALVAPGSARRPDVVNSALGQALTLLGSLGGPVLLVTVIAVWALRATRDGASAAGPAPRKLKGLKIAEVRPGAKELDEVRALFEQYARALDFDLAFQGFESELKALPGDYAPPRGRLLLAKVAGQPAGCVALRALEGDGAGDAAELKRLFVRPQFRHAGLGRALAEAALAEAKGLGYARVRLDTVPAMREALALYKAIGFHEIAPYRDNPVAGASFFEKPLA